MKRFKQSGLSMIELMVAMAMGLFMMAGLIGVVVSSQTANQRVTEFSEMQENGRFAADQLAQSIAMADHWGGVESDAVETPTGIINAVGGCDEAWVTNLDESVRGYEGANSIALVADFPNGCIGNSQYLAGTDLLTLRYAGTSGMTDDHSGGDDKDKIYLRTRTGGAARLFEGDSDVSGTYTIGDGWIIYPFVIETYFVSPCSNIAGACDDGIPTLVRQTIHKGSANADQLNLEPLIENVEQLQFQYGSDTDSDDDVDRFDTASAVPDWEDVISVRFSLLARSSDIDPNFSDTNSYTHDSYMASGAVGAMVPVAQRGFHRKQYSRVIQIRNRSRK